jgi:hypothetical protein
LFDLSWFLIVYALAVVGASGILGVILFLDYRKHQKNEQSPPIYSSNLPILANIKMLGK